MSTINWQQAMAAAKNASFEPLPDGEYDVVCIESTPTESSTGKPMIRAKYQVESGPNAGKKVFTQYTFSADSDNSLSFFFQHMAFHGLDASFFATDPAWETVASTLLGKRVRFRLGTREWQGQQRNNVERVMPAQTPAPMAGVATPMMQAPQPMQQPVPQVPMQQPVMQPAAAMTPQVPVQQPMQPAPMQQPMQPMQVQQPVQQPQMPTAAPQQLETRLQTQQVGPFTVLEQVPVQQPVQQAPQANDPQFLQQFQPDPNQLGVGGQPQAEAAPPQPDVPPAQPQQPQQEGPALPEVPYG